MLRAKISMISVLFLGLFFFCSNMLWGEDWKRYGTNESGEFYYDAESITRPAKNKVRVWAKMVHSKKNIKKLGKDLEDLVYSKRLWEINCADKKIRRLSKVAYSKSGKILISDNKEEKWQGISPKSLTGKLYEKVCK